MMLLVKGQQVLLDDEDWNKVKHFTWSLGGGRKDKPYVLASTPDRTTVYLHRLVMDAPSGYEVDHKNRNRLDNRKHNLRVVDSTLNKLNMGIRANNTSGVKGVSWNKASKKWRARIKIRGKEYMLGRFTSLQAAAKARREAEGKLAWSI